MLTLRFCSTQRESSSALPLELPSTRSCSVAWLEPGSRIGRAKLLRRQSALCGVLHCWQSAASMALWYRVGMPALKIRRRRGLEAQTPTHRRVSRSWRIKLRLFEAQAMGLEPRQGRLRRRCSRILRLSPEAGDCRPQSCLRHRLLEACCRSQIIQRGTPKACFCAVALQTWQSYTLLQPPFPAVELFHVSASPSDPRCCQPAGVSTKSTLLSRPSSPARSEISPSFELCRTGFSQAPRAWGAGEITRRSQCVWQIRWERHSTAAVSRRLSTGSQQQARSRTTLVPFG
mmetsp:Transcript_40059/g.105094  ORF Transcript_40059/g.105094 Transcript_40059/m.105094 type:complete len:288 (+) Transcript_40059:1112-1975(+)